MAKTSGGVRIFANSESDKTASQKIASIIDDIKVKGFTKQQPFSIGNIEDRMVEFASANDIELQSNTIYISAHSISHALRDSKKEKGLAVSEADLISFPNRRFSLDLYYDGKSFVYTDYNNKFILNTNYELKIDRQKTKKVTFVTAGKTDGTEFKMKKYKKI